MRSKIKTIIFGLSLLMLFQTTSAVTIEKLKQHPPFKEYIEKLEKVKIKDQVSFFQYDKEFAKAGNLDIKKAVTLPENMHGAGISVVKIKDGNDSQFEKYDCRIHFILKNQKDYWLPKDSYGSWYDVRAIADGIESLTGVENIKFGKIVDNYSRQYIGASIENPKPNDMFSAGSVILLKFMKNIYPNMTYVEFSSYCGDSLQIERKPAIWIEKISGPDYKIDREPFLYKYFYQFKIPKILLKQACPYVQKGATYNDWNARITSKIFQYEKIERYNLTNSEDNYACI